MELFLQYGHRVLTLSITRKCVCFHRVFFFVSLNKNIIVTQCMNYFILFCCSFIFLILQTFCPMLGCMMLEPAYCLIFKSICILFNKHYIIFFIIFKLFHFIQKILWPFSTNFEVN